jgi:hypothetical protein
MPSFPVDRTEQEESGENQSTPYIEPDWVNVTPQELEYTLVMYDTDGTSVQQIEMNRAEFVALKQCLAGLRQKPM